MLNIVFTSKLFLIFRSKSELATQSVLQTVVRSKRNQESRCINPVSQDWINSKEILPGSPALIIFSLLLLVISLSFKLNIKSLQFKFTTTLVTRGRSEMKWFKSLRLAPGYADRGRPVQGEMDLAGDLQHAGLLPGLCWGSAGPPDSQVSEKGSLPPPQDWSSPELHWLHEKGTIRLSFRARNEFCSFSCLVLLR